MLIRAKTLHLVPSNSAACSHWCICGVLAVSPELHVESRLLIGPVNIAPDARGCMRIIVFYNVKINYVAGWCICRIDHDEIGIFPRNRFQGKFSNLFPCSGKH